jgi:outer membrane lipoprotein SlyB
MGLGAPRHSRGHNFRQVQPFQEKFMSSSNLHSRQLATPVRQAVCALACAAWALLLQSSAHAQTSTGTASTASTTSTKTQAQTKPPACANCGSVESVNEVNKEGKGTGLGAVGGAVAGGLLGNQFGGGKGKTAMTVAGALGGGFAGNAVEKKVRSETVYDVNVRMEDGSLRTVQESQTYAIGTKVVVDGNTLKPAASSGSSATK